MEIDFTEKHIDRLLWLIDLWIKDLYILREDAKSTKNIDQELTDYEYIKIILNEAKEMDTGTEDTAT